MAENVSKSSHAILFTDHLGAGSSWAKATWALSPPGRLRSFAVSRLPAGEIKPKVIKTRRRTDANIEHCLYTPKHIEYPWDFGHARLLGPYLSGASLL